MKQRLAVTNVALIAALLVPVVTIAQSAPSASVTPVKLAVPAPASSKKAANPSSPNANKDQPIEISSDKLDVYQDDHKAIFTGNVIAIQGTMNMRSTQMTVFYRQADAKPKPGQPAPAPKPKAAGEDDGPPGISRIEAQGNVVFTTPTETAQGELGVYNADTDMIDLTGPVVTLTRDKNVLKGTHMNYNMDTGRSILTAGGGAQDVTGVTGSKPARVHGLFVPQSDKQKAAQPVQAAPTTQTAPTTGQ